MHDPRVGAAVRAIRHRRGWRQVDLAKAAGVSQSLISAVEHGHLSGVSIGTVRDVVAALGVRMEIELKWRGGAIDRLLDERHATLVGRTVTLLRQFGWATEVEVSYAHYGERGSIDVLAWHPAERGLLVVEVKSELASVEATLRKLDEKARLAPVVFTGGRERPAHVSRLVVFPGTMTARRAVARHAAVLDAAFPARGGALRSWLRQPAGTVRGLLFVTDSSQVNGRWGQTTRIRRKAAQPCVIGGDQGPTTAVPTPGQLRG
jgi:transcriptional regulator with XRE-family HTH domain